jgi:hypothetical protein
MRMTWGMAWTGRAAALGLLGLALLGLGAPAGLTQPAAAGEVAFRAQVKHMRMQLPHLDRGKKSEDAVEVVLSGELFEPPRRLGAVERAQADLSTPEAAARSDFSAWKADDVEWILANFAAADQAALAEFLDDAEMRAASKAAFAKQDVLILWGVVRHEAYALVLLTYGQGAERARGLTATFVEEAGAWKRTNALSADETLDLVWSAFRLGEMTARP